VLAIAGCGFQLRGIDISALESINLVTPGATGETRRVFSRALSDAGVELVPASPDIVTVIVFDERSVRRPVSTSAVMDVAEYELRIEVDISVNRGEKALLPEAFLVAERVYAIDSRNLSGSYEEQTMLLEEIRRDLARQMIRIVEASALRLDENG
jgi:LPS-assembly lipoprotein